MPKRRFEFSARKRHDVTQVSVAARPAQAPCQTQGAWRARVLRTAGDHRARVDRSGTMRTLIDRCGLARWRRCRPTASLWLALAAGSAHAQSLHDAFEQAWARQPAAQAQAYRGSEFSARVDAADALAPAPPSLLLRERSDRLNNNAGAIELEAELAVPLWLPGQRDRESALASAEQAQFRDGLASAKLKLAGEVREAYWQARAAEGDFAAAARRLDDSVALAADVERRYRAGDLARTDFNLARGSELGARGAATDAEVRTMRATQAFSALTGMNAMPRDGEDLALQPPPLAEHPALRQLDRSADTADARLRLAADITRDNPEFTLGYRRDRASSADLYANSVALGIRIPFATDARNRPRVAAANADFIEARTAHARERDRLEAELLASQRELLQVRAALALAEERRRLAAENDQLLGKAFALGEIDLATRLRISAERYAADADAVRSRLEVGRAISRLNQAFGVLP